MALKRMAKGLAGVARQLARTPGDAAETNACPVAAVIADPGRLTGTHHDKPFADGKTIRVQDALTFSWPNGNAGATSRRARREV